MKLLGTIQSKYKTPFLLLISFGLIFSAFGFTGGSYDLITVASSVLAILTTTILAFAVFGAKKYKFYEDRVVIVDRLTGTRDVAYDDVALAVYVDDIMGRFKLVKHDGESLSLAASDPDRADKLLRSCLPSTAEVLERRELDPRDDRRRDNALEMVLAEYAADYQDDPEHPPIIDGDTFEGITGVSASNADLSLLSEVHDVESTSDLDAADLGAEGAMTGGSRAGDKVVRQPGLFE